MSCPRSAHIASMVEAGISGLYQLMAAENSADRAWYCSAGSLKDVQINVQIVVHDSPRVRLCPGVCPLHPHGG